MFTIRVKSIDFDPQPGQDSAPCSYPEKLRMRTNTHRLDKIIPWTLKCTGTLEKEVDSKNGEQGRDTVAWEQVKEINNLQEKAGAVAVVMQEGIVNIGFVTQYHTILWQKVELGVPKKLVPQRATERTPLPISQITSVLSGIALALLWHCSNSFSTGTIGYDIGAFIN